MRSAPYSLSDSAAVGHAFFSFPDRCFILFFIHLTGSRCHTSMLHSLLPSVWNQQFACTGPLR